MLTTILNPKPGWKINPRAQIVLGILKGLQRNEGKCPCVNDSEDPACPCSNYREKDHCCCSLYVKTDA